LLTDVINDKLNVDDRVERHFAAASAYTQSFCALLSMHTVNICVNIYTSVWSLTVNIFTTRCTTVQSAVLLSHVVCPFVHLSVTLVDHDHVGLKSWKLIAQTISPTSSLFVAQR